jgi:hypothetical protein
MKEVTPRSNPTATWRTNAFGEGSRIGYIYTDSSAETAALTNNI